MTKQSFSPCEAEHGLFTSLFSTPELTSRTGGSAWVAAILRFEAALATAQARADLIPADVAEAIVAGCRPENFDIASIARRAVGSATPVVPLVEDLTTKVESPADAFVHYGATSQDALDSAAMLITTEALAVIVEDLRAAASDCARLAEEHRSTLMIGRTLLQQATPTTFGRRCAAWLVALTDGILELQRIRTERLAVQLGGPTGTLSAFGTDGTRVLSLLAEELGLAEPVLAWHTDRSRIGHLAGTLGTVSGTLAKIALDVKLHAQTEVGELTVTNTGGSSAMPHKRNPVDAVLVTAATTRVPGLVSTLFAAMPQEHERAAGAWQAEWEPLTELLRLVGAAAAGIRRVLADLEVHTDAMSSNVDTTNGLIMTSSATTPLLEFMSRHAAHRLMTRLCRRVVQRGTSLRVEMLADEEVRAVLSEDEIHAATDPADDLGSAHVFVDRALAHNRNQL